MATMAYSKGVKTLCVPQNAVITPERNAMSTVGHTPRNPAEITQGMAISTCTIGEAFSLGTFGSGMGLKLVR